MATKHVTLDEVRHGPQEWMLERAQEAQREQVVKGRRKVAGRDRGLAHLVDRRCAFGRRGESSIRCAVVERTNEATAWFVVITHDVPPLELSVAASDEGLR